MFDVVPYSRSGGIVQAFSEARKLSMKSTFPLSTQTVLMQKRHYRMLRYERV